MIRQLLLIPFFLTSFLSSAFANHKSLPISERKIEMDFQIISYLPVTDLPQNQVRVKGIGKTKKGEIIYDAQVGILGSDKTIKVDESGKFELLMNVKDSAFYYYHEDYADLLINRIVLKGGHELIIEIYPKRKIGDDVKVPVVAYKPVIYAYSKERLSVAMRLKPKGDFTFTYPVYDNGWEFIATPKGAIEMKGKTYPYLFWKGEIDLNIEKEENEVLKGFIIKTDTIITFFENQLKKAGLNEHEMTDFITFWGSKLQQSPFAYIQFLVDDEYDKQIAKMEISPKPDNMRRIYMLYTPFMSKPKMKVEPQVLNSFLRDGFTIVEWGGSQIKPFAL
ncbi:MAG: hypothetical protein ACPG21_01095 [Crocinitomicaceae bacterium]